MANTKRFESISDSTLEDFVRAYTADAKRHGEYVTLAKELEAAHREIGVCSKAADLVTYHVGMESYYHGNAKDAAAEVTRRNAEVDAAAEQHEHNTANLC